LTQGAKLAAANIVSMGKVSDKAMGKNSCQPEGLRPQSRRAPQRAAGAPVPGDATAKARMWTARVARHVSLRGRIHRPGPTEPAPPAARHFVDRLGHIRDMTCAVLRVSRNSGRNAYVLH